VVADPDPSDGDFAEGGPEGIGPCAPAPDADAAFAVTTLEDQFLVGLLDEGPEGNFSITVGNRGAHLVGAQGWR
jgi:hypothetical protein